MTASVGRRPSGPGTGLPHTHTKTRQATLLPFHPHHQGFMPTAALNVTCACCSQCFAKTQNNCSDESITRYSAKLMDSIRGLDNINTKSAAFYRKQVAIMAFLYATPATQNNSLMTIEAIPGIPQNRKCCCIYNKLLEMLKQSMTTRWARALCTAPNEPALPERVSDQSKYSTLLN